MSLRFILQPKDDCRRMFTSLDVEFMLTPSSQLDSMHSCLCYSVALVVYQYVMRGSLQDADQAPRLCSALKSVGCGPPCLVELSSPSATAAPTFVCRER